MFKSLPLLALLGLAASPVVAAEQAWTGWHAGGHAGHASGDSRADVGLDGAWSIETQALRDDVSAGWSTDLGPDGSAFGLLFGYDHQFASGFVLGAELDYASLDISDSRATGLQPAPSVPTLSYDYANTIELDDKWSLRARFGYASGRHLFFASAGWVQVDATASASVASNGGYLKLGRQSGTLDGFEWGLGYAFDFGNQWSLRGEYLMTDLDDLRYDTDYLPGSTTTSSAPISTPSSSALVPTRPSMLPARMRRSVSRRSVGR